MNGITEANPRPIFSPTRLSSPIALGTLPFWTLLSGC